MFASRYFADRYFAPRYWAKVGATIPGQDVTLGSINITVTTNPPTITQVALGGGLAPAGKSKSGKRKLYGKRRTIIINDRVYYATDGELPNLLEGILERAAKPAEAVKLSRKERRKAKEAASAEEIVGRIVQPARFDTNALLDQFYALQDQFARADDEVALLALAAARAKILRDQDDEDDDEFVMLMS